MTFWTEEKTAEALKLWNEGNSAQLIANKIRAVSRSSVISKLYQIGAPKRSKVAAQTAAVVESKRKTGGGGWKHARSQQAGKPAPSPAASASEAPCPPGIVHLLRTAAVAPLDIPLTRLSDKACRYPVTGVATARPHLQGADTLFCGAAALADHPYCAAHQEIVRLPARRAAVA